MFAPSPWTVQTCPLTVALPATPTLPTSVDVHVCARAAPASSTNAIAHTAPAICHFMETHLLLSHDA